MLPAKIYRCGRFFGVIIVFFGFFVIHDTVSAALGACTGVVSPAAISTSQSTDLSFSIQVQNGDMAATMLKIYRPSGNYTITGASSLNGGTLLSLLESDVTISDIQIDVGETESYTVTVNPTSYETTSEPWTVELSVGGDGWVQCTGSLDTSIEYPAISINGVTASAVSSSSESIAFTTSSPATITLSYGLTDLYGDSVVTDTFQSNHTITLSNLAAGTTYHYQIAATAESGGGATTADATFTTQAAPTPTPTPTTVPTATPTSVPGVTPSSTPTASTTPTTSATSPSSTPTPTTTTTTVTVLVTPTPAPDTTKPLVSINPQARRVLAELTSITGTVVESVGINSITCKINSGVWKAATSSKNSATMYIFSCSPSDIVEGSNTITVRAADTSGNVSNEATQTIVIDKTAPSVRLDTDLSQAFFDPPMIRGTVTDASGVQSVRITLDNGATWQSVQLVSTSPTDASFAVQTVVPDEGTYAIVAEVTDVIGNTAKVKSGELLIDRLPPSSGNVGFFRQSQPVSQYKDGKIALAAGIPYEIVVQTMGGPTDVTIKLVSQENPSNGSVAFTLAQYGSPKLFRGTISVPDEKIYELVADAVDGAGKKQSKTIASVVGIPSGTIVDEAGLPVENAKVSVFYKDPYTSLVESLPLSAFGQPLPFQTDAFGRYAITVPPGVYALMVEKPGYKTHVTSLVTSSVRSDIAYHLVLHKLPSIAIGPFTFTLPYFPDVTSKDQSIHADQSVIEQVLPEVRGIIRNASYETVIPIALWHPFTPSLINLAEKLQKEGKSVALILPMETEEAIRALQVRRKITVPILADLQGEIFSDYALGIIPSIVKKTTNGWSISHQLGVVQY